MPPRPTKLTVAITGTFLNAFWLDVNSGRAQVEAITKSIVDKERNCPGRKISQAILLQNLTSSVQVRQIRRNLEELPVVIKAGDQ